MPSAHKKLVDDKILREYYTTFNPDPPTIIIIHMKSLSNQYTWTHKDLATDEQVTNYYTNEHPNTVLLEAFKMCNMINTELDKGNNNGTIYYTIILLCYTIM